MEIDTHLSTNNKRTRDDEIAEETPIKKQHNLNAQKTKETFEIALELAKKKPVLNKCLQENNKITLFKCIQDIESEKSEKYHKSISKNIYQLASMEHEFASLSVRVLVYFHHKNTKVSFVETMKDINQWIPDQVKAVIPPEKWQEGKKTIANKYIELIEKHLAQGHDIDACLNHDLDFVMFTHMGAEQLLHKYLLKIGDKVVERFQHFWMRVALQLGGEDWEQVKTNYFLFSHGFYTHATPTLYSAGADQFTPSSCYLLSLKEDSIDGIFETVKRCALISKAAGGVGLNITGLRPADDYIRSSGGKTTGLAPVAKIFNDTAQYVDQGGGKRKGAFSLWAEPWIQDVNMMMGLKANSSGGNAGLDEILTKDLFFGLWNPDLFFKKMLDKNGDRTYYLLNPNYCKGLEDSWGFEQEMLYEWYVQKGLGKKIDIRELWSKIISTSFDTGTPYMMAADQCNRLANQNNYPTKIKSSNLCCEIIEHTDANRVSVCNLASLNLPAYVKTNSDGSVYFDFIAFGFSIRNSIRNLDKTIDINFYPIKEAETTNLEDRPCALGVSGKAKMFALLGLPWESEEAKKLNREIWEAMYYCALVESCELAKKNGPYPSYNLNGGSHLKRGLFHWELWDKNNKKANDFLNEVEYKIRTEAGANLPAEFVESFKQKYQPHRSWQLDGVKLSGRYDWEALRAKIAENGVRNSQLLAAMPTASTAAIFGNPEGIEPYPALIAVRYTGVSETILIPDEFVADLESYGLYTPEIINKIKANEGSIQNIPEIPYELKMIYKTQFEIPRTDLLEMARDRQIFCDQAQSFSNYFENHFNENESEEEAQKKLTHLLQLVSNYYLQAWSLGLKTIIYYNRQRRVGAAFKITLDADAMKTKSVVLNSAESKQENISSEFREQLTDTEIDNFRPDLTDDDIDNFKPLGTCNSKNTNGCSSCG